MNLAERATRGALVTVGGQATKFVAQLVILVVLARLLQPSDYGLLAMVTAIVVVATSITDLGLSLAAVAAPEISQQQRSNLFWISSSLGLATAAGVYALSAPLAEYYSRPEVEGIAQVLCLVFIVNGLAGQFRAELNRRLRFASLAVSEVVAVLGAAGIALGLAGAGYGYWALVLQQVSQSLILLVYYVLASKWCPSLPSRHAPMHSLLSFGAETMLLQVLNVASSNVDNFAIGRFQGANSLGEYNRGFQVFSIPLLQLVSPLTRVAVPVLSRLRSEPERFVAYAGRAHLALTYLLLSSLLVLGVGGSNLISVALGQRWTNAGTVMQILAVGGAFQALGYVYYWVFLALGRVRTLLICESVGRAAMVCAVILGSVRSIYLAAVGYSFGLAMVWASSTVGLRTLPFSIREVLTISIRPAVLFFALFAQSLVVDSLLRGQSAYTRLAVCYTATLVLGGIAMLLVRSLRSDMRTLVDTLKSLRQSS